MINRNRFSALLVFICASVLFAQYNPSLRNVRGWNTFRAQITTLNIKSTIIGLTSRNEMEISFRDVESAPGTDSMELNLNFTLPRNSVVDSMYLWIRGVPQAAALKERWKAVQAYWRIVGFRWDPALLQKTYGDGYNLRVFPFSHAEERKVRICYSSPLQPSGTYLTLGYPLELAAGSAAPLQEVSVKAEMVGYDKRNVSVLDPNNIEYQITGDAAGNSTLLSSGKAIIPGSTLTLQLPNNENGITASFMKRGTNDVSFMALVDPQKIMNVSSARKKNVLIIWNMVQDQDYYYQYWDGTSYVGKPYVSKYTSYYYDQTQFSAERAAMSAFIRTFLSSGDSLNIIVNDGEKSALGTGPVSFTPSMESTVDKFLLKEVSTGPRTTGCLSPMNFLRQALQSASAYDTLDLIIIDKAYSYQYPFDSAGVDAEINRLLGILPEKTTVFGLIGYNWNNPVARVQNALIQKRNGMAFYSWGDMNEIFGSIGRTLSPLIEPANISISVTGGGFVYDVYGPADKRIYLSMPVMYVGKINGSARNLAIEFNGVYNNKNYRFSRTIPVALSSPVSDEIEKVWAAAKVKDLTYMRSQDYALNEYSQATALSLKYRILTDQTALIALEPGLLDSSWYVDDSPKDPGMATHIAAERMAVNLTASMSVSASNGAVCISLAGLKAFKARDLSLRIYNAQGRLAVDLSAKVDVSKNSQMLQWKPVGVAKGFYFIRLRLGKNMIEKHVLFVR